ncbi:MAG: 1-acyl-sn-glycerol-3-phosphate acyltransferase [Bacteroidota bacterium]|nr:1-acyl-sn-glycerol-3-phosphate acyltransferase [Bacteroidota bacterium]
MLKYICKILLNLWGWKGISGPLKENKGIIIGAPHTSNLDFLVSWMYYTSLGMKASFLIKQEAFVWPFGSLLKKMGGIPVDRRHGANSIMQVVDEFKKRKTLHLCITPEGTRSKTTRWKAGFHAIARNADIPVYLGVFDYGKKEIGIFEKFELTDDVNADMRRLRSRYKNVTARHPEKFSVGDID